MHNPINSDKGENKESSLKEGFLFSINVISRIYTINVTHIKQDKSETSQCYSMEEFLTSITKWCSCTGINPLYCRQWRVRTRLIDNKEMDCTIIEFERIKINKDDESRGIRAIIGTNLEEDTQLISKTQREQDMYASHKKNVHLSTQ